jgi:hypothetical protein
VGVKFHYTQPDFAELILAEQTYRVSAQAGRVGHGLYVTSAAPGSMTDEQLLARAVAGPGCGPKGSMADAGYANLTSESKLSCGI